MQRTIVSVLFVTLIVFSAFSQSLLYSHLTKKLVWRYLISKLTLVADGKHDKDFATQYLIVDKNSSVDVRLLRRGGFAATLIHKVI
jgi:hypothetical protein